MQTLLYIGLGVAIVGTCSSTVFLVLVLLGVRKFHADARRAARQAAEIRELPPVSILKPLHNIEVRLKENLESFFRQDYPHYEIIFAVDREDNTALPVVREVCALYPQIPSKIVITGDPPWPNPPAYAFYRMSEVAAHGILATSDSDVDVSPNYLREIVPPLLEPAVGMLTCVYRGKNVAGFWSGLTAIGMSVEMTAGVLVANLLEGIKFGLGPTIALRRDALERVGGYSATAECLANDFVIGNLISKAGYRVVLSRNIIDHVVNHPTFGSMWNNQLRWAKSTRRSRPKGHLGSGLTYAMPYGILGYVIAALLGHPGLGASLLGMAVLNRVIETWAVGWGVVRDPRARQAPWLYPLRDLVGFAVWCASYSSPQITWRGRRYEIAGEQIASREKSA